MVAGLPDSQQKFAIPVAAFVADERAVIGSYMGSCVPQRDSLDSWNSTGADACR